METQRHITFAIETGYGQTIYIEQVGISGLFVMRTRNEIWGDDGERIVSVEETECVLCPSTASRLAVAIYQACQEAM